MKQYLHALDLGAEGKLPSRIDDSSNPSASVVRELMNAGYLTGIDASSFDGPAYLEPAITLAGREYLATLRKSAAGNRGRSQKGRSEQVRLMASKYVRRGAWSGIESEFGVSKRTLGKRISFVKDEFKRGVIFRDIEQAYLLAHYGFNKPAVILAGGVIEELLRLYLEHKCIRPGNNKLDSYIKACEENGLIKGAIHRLADSIRQFRNIVHLERETSERYTISKATAKGAVSSVFTISNEFIS